MREPIEGIEIIYYGKVSLQTFWKDNERWWVIRDLCELYNIQNEKVALGWLPAALEWIPKDNRIRIDKKFVYTKRTLSGEGEEKVINDVGRKILGLCSGCDYANDFEEWLAQKPISHGKLQNSDLKLFNVDGIDCYYKDDVAYLKLETVARGLGFTQTQVKNKTEYTSIRWETVFRYLEELGFPNKLGKDDFIPENVFYRLAMKAKNEAAERFQAKIADEIIPSIRRTGSYSLTGVPAMFQPQRATANNEMLLEMKQSIDDMQEQSRELIDQNKKLAEQNKELTKQLKSMLNVMSQPAESNWQSGIDNAIKKLCADNHLSVSATKGRMYKELERELGCSINERLSRLRQRKRNAGMKCSEVISLTKLDAIANDKKLRAAFENIVNKWQTSPIAVTKE